MIRLSSAEKRFVAQSEDLEQLAMDRELITPEIYSHNDFYGHAAILKSYCGIPEKYPLKTSIEHGMFFSEFLYQTELDLDFPAMMVMSRLRLPVLSRNTRKALFAAGPVIQYAKPYLDQVAFQKEKNRLGRSLLLFPSHSTHHVTSEFDIHGLCREVETRSRGFNSIRVCLYWKDVLLGRAQAYREQGFECVTAGHIYDPLFLPRLRSIIELSDVTLSNICGGQLGYCVGLGKPHVLLQLDEPRHAAPSEVLKRDVNSTLSANHHFRRINKLFSHRSEELTSEQRETVADYWGFDLKRSPVELRTMFQIAEDMYRERELLKLSNEPMMRIQEVRYINAGRADYAEFLRMQSKLIAHSLIKEKAESELYDTSV